MTSTCIRTRSGGSPRRHARPRRELSKQNLLTGIDKTDGQIPLAFDIGGQRVLTLRLPSNRLLLPGAERADKDGFAAACGGSLPGERARSQTWHACAVGDV